MNERIFELARQSGATDENGSRATGVFCFTEQELNGFAELIVRECMGVARGMRNPPNLNYKPSDRFVDELRLHFGVKE
jgi:hypothetical protein